MPRHYLRGEALVKKYNGRNVVNGVSLSLRQGEIVGLLGPNGAGKTTTFYLLTGLIRAGAGDVIFDDETITRWPMYKRARLGMAYLPQESSVFRGLTVEENLLAILETLPLTRYQRQERLEQLLEELNLVRIRKSKACQLSGGERRRVEVTRALVTKPAFLLLDEPFAGIDPIAVEDIQNIVARLKQKNIGILITDHNVHETLAITDRAYIIYDGKILIEGDSFTIGNDPQAREFFLGEKFSLNR
ncbi:MAG: LPS export ABC transporter ATP-binding protein [candidate division KSB1 bacterium]|nr:LPS export ABC transporter ATP-binding protein [candidate division KSB1 bacterium]MDZ7311284.1 LPS export ABC transporter ATP-binding protein [candidate division KSB1 bacterium]